ncbi:MAG: hypothetical protein P1P81_00845 [Desulfobulbales bacterium]|nr:hypothetical protein [Desulfobulbales bacterium]
MARQTRENPVLTGTVILAAAAVGAILAFRAVRLVGVGLAIILGKTNRGPLKKHKLS